MLERLLRGWWAWLLLSAVVVALDQLTKHLVQQAVPFGSPVRVTPFFDLVLVYNPGAAFSFLSTAPGWQRELFIGIAAVAAVLIVFLLRRNVADRLFCFALSLILGGALGNVIDRLLHGHVVDFLDFHFRFLQPLFPQGHFPSFNVADSAITVGAACLIIDELRRVRRA